MHERQAHSGGAGIRRIKSASLKDIEKDGGRRFHEVGGLGLMNRMYAMQRANGDWFALDFHGVARVPVFGSSWEAMQARMRNVGMLLFKPARLDERALNDLAPTKTENSAAFWLVDNPSVNLSQGRPLEYTQLVPLVHDTEGTTPLWSIVRG